MKYALILVSAGLALAAPQAGPQVASAHADEPGLAGSTIATADPEGDVSAFVATDPDGTVSLSSSAHGEAPPAAADAPAAAAPAWTKCERCYAVASTQEGCSKEGTSLEQHAKCMCEGSFFDEWRGCRSCMLEEGSINAAYHEAYLSVVSTASAALCTGSPTASFQPLFASAEAARTREGAEPLPAVPAAAADAVVTPAPSLADAAAPGVVFPAGAQADGFFAVAEAEAKAAASVVIAGDDVSGFYAGADAEAAAKAEVGADANGAVAAEASAEAAAEAVAVAGGQTTSVATTARAAAATTATRAATTSPAGAFGGNSTAAATTASKPLKASAATTGKVASGLVMAVVGAAAALMAF